MLKSRLYARFRDLPVRIASALLLITLTLGLTYWSALSFYALLILGGILMHQEWQTLTENEPLLYKVGGPIYIGLPIWSLIVLRGDYLTASGLNAIIFLFIMVWTSDSAAYFCGKLLGRHKLAPTISPTKSWEGAIGGFLFTAIAGAIGSLYVISPAGMAHGLLCGGLLSIAVQAGDLFESWLKRLAGVKNSSNLIPGHGGLLDRVDGLVFAAPVYLLWITLL